MICSPWRTSLLCRLDRVLLLLSLLVVVVVVAVLVVVIIVSLLRFGRRQNPRRHLYVVAWMEIRPRSSSTYLSTHLYTHHDETHVYRHLHTRVRMFALTLEDTSTSSRGRIFCLSFVSCLLFAFVLARFRDHE